MHVLKGITIKCPKIWLNMKWFLKNALKHPINSEAMLETPHTINPLVDYARTMLEANEK